jgi:hypothetical protein
VLDGSIIILVNEIIHQEWARNKSTTEDKIKDLEKKIKHLTESLSNIESYITGQCSEQFEIIREKLIAEILSRIEKNKTHIREVEDLLIKHTINIPITDKAKTEVVDLALKKKAPFIGDKKNSSADAVILISSIRYIQAELKEEVSNPFDELFTQNHQLLEPMYYFPETYFVSSNKGDFSDPHDREKIHPDLEPILNETNTKFFYSLFPLVNILEEEFLTREEVESLDFDFDYCDVCDFEFTTVEYSEPFKISDEFNVYKDPKQLSIPSFPISHDDYQTTVREANCNHCGSKFLECPCGTLNHINEYDQIFECEGECGRHFIAHADIDKKGTIHALDYEILKGRDCESCGDFFQSDTEFCLKCEGNFAE